MIKKWVLKAIVQKTISYFPKRDLLNLWFQKNITKGVHFDSVHFDYKVRHAKDHIAFFRDNKNFSFTESTVIEIGTGWYPVIPISLFLEGFGRIVSLDLNNYLSKKTLLETLVLFIQKEKENHLSQYINIKDDRWQVIKEIVAKKERLTLQEMCHLLRFEFTVCDLSKPPINIPKAEFMCSNNTFEHIHKNLMRKILVNCKSLIKAGGIMSHFIDMTDHFCHFDKSITEYNFLKYSEKRWNIIDNDIQPQNRMRLVNYKELYKELQIPITKEVIWPSKVHLLEGFPIHDEFSKYSVKQLAIFHAYLISDINSSNLT